MKMWTEYRKAVARRNAKMIAAYRRGAKAAELAERFGVTRQRVEQIVKPNGEPK